MLKELIIYVIACGFLKWQINLIFTF